MTGGTVAPTARSATTSFDLERFEWTAPDRLEVAGRWFGMRGLRFMRPTLDLRAGEDRHRLLALLEHKPWIAEEGELWVAAFPWEGDRAKLTAAELAVGPSLAVELPVPGGSRKPNGRSRKPPKRAPVRAEPSRERLVEEARQAREERDLAFRERDAALAMRETATGERTAAVRAQKGLARERDAAIAARAETLEQLESVRAELDAAIAERNEAVAELESIRLKLEPAVAASAAAMKELESVMAQRDEAIAGRGAALRARELALEERDRVMEALETLRRERDEAVRARDTLAHERDAAVRQLESRERFSRDRAARRREAELHGGNEGEPEHQPTLVSPAISASSPPPATPTTAVQPARPRERPGLSASAARWLAVGVIVLLLVILAVFIHPLF